MLRLRLASLALASGFLFTLSGCCSLCQEGPLFPRLSNWSLFNRNRGEVDCDCHSAMMPPMTEGPALLPPGAFPPPPVVNQPPQVLKVPQAPPMPYIPTN